MFARTRLYINGRSPAETVGSNPTGACMFVCYECCVLSGRGPCDELITRPEGSYRLWCVVVCDLRNLVNEEALAHWEALAPKTNKYYVTNAYM